MESFILFEYVNSFFGADTRVPIRSTTKITEYISYHGKTFKFVESRVDKDRNERLHLYREIVAQDIINQVIC